MNNIQFETNSYALINSSFSEIDELISNLKKYENLEIEIQGHTDNVGNYDYNLKLSELRAKSVYNYIIKSDSLLLERITFKGYGEDKPIENNNTEGRAINRRTSFLIKNFISIPSPIEVFQILFSSLISLIGTVKDSAFPEYIISLTFPSKKLIKI